MHQESEIVIKKHKNDTLYNNYIIFRLCWLVNYGLSDMQTSSFSEGSVMTDIFTIGYKKLTKTYQFCIKYHVFSI